MHTRFFIFPDMETSFVLASAAGMTGIDEQGEPFFIRYTDRYAIDVVGTVYTPTGVTLQGPDGPYPEMAAQPGWYVCSRIISGEPLPTSFEPYEVFPETPWREFF